MTCWEVRLWPNLQCWVVLTPISTPGGEGVCQLVHVWKNPHLMEKSSEPLPRPPCCSPGNTGLMDPPEAQEELAGAVGRTG